MEIELKDFLHRKNRRHDRIQTCHDFLSCVLFRYKRASPMNTSINCNVFPYIVDNFNVCFNYCYIRDVTKAMVYVQLKW